MIEDLNSFLKKYNCRAGIISFDRLKEIEDEINSLYKNKSIDEVMHKIYLSNFSYNVKEDSFKPESVIVVAAPCPCSRIYFNIRNKRFHVLIPPAYVGQRMMDQKIKEILDCYLAGTGYKVLPARLPKKLIAAHSGLSLYGRNNISYIQGFGSFFNLTSFFSNISCDYENWYKKKELKNCLSCKACFKSCPTGAIDTKRFLIHADRCLTFFNEEPGDFPPWIRHESHHCLVGCIKCQIVCPYNKPFIDCFEDVGEFTAEETEILLRNSLVEKIPSLIVNKLNLLDLQDYISVIPRNLKALLRKDKI